MPALMTQTDRQIHRLQQQIRQHEIWVHVDRADRRAVAWNLTKIAAAGAARATGDGIMIELTPPPHDNPWSEQSAFPPYRARPTKITLNTGSTVFPDKETGLVKVWHEEDAVALERKGWRRDKISAHDKAVASNLLSKGLAAGMTRMTGGTAPILPKMPSDDELRKRAAVAAARHDGWGGTVPDAPRTRIVIGEVPTDDKAFDDGRVMIEHDVDQGAIVIHSVRIPLAQVDADLRNAFVASAANFNTIQNKEEATTARTIIGAIVAGIMRRHQPIAEVVRRVKQSQRFD